MWLSCRPFTSFSPIFSRCPPFARFPLAMAKEFGDAALWLPPELLYDELLFGEARSRRTEAAAAAFALGSNPEAAPPPETLSALEECVAALARQMNHASILAAEKTKLMAEKTEGAVGFAHSALFNRLAAAKRSSKGPYVVSSSPMCLLEQPVDDDPWDVFSEAAAQVIRLNQSNARYLQKLQDYGLLDLSQMPSPGAQYTNPAATPQQQQFQAAQFRYLKQQQVLKQQLSTAWEGQGMARGSRPHGWPQPAWPAPQRQKQPLQPGHVMRSAYLNSRPVAKRVSTGTGVFLPRTQLCKPEPQRTPIKSPVTPPLSNQGQITNCDALYSPFVMQSGCSTVLVPGRVVQALNPTLELKSRDAFLHDHDARNGWLSNQQKLNKQETQPTPVAVREVQLPQEWTY
ncbi:hypothetical protein Cni_G04270 [Canna indica]|uniref:Uncharacterized protein n=1 Tax=Canna indica TaxID=4628 RepID=A0AAQ3JUE7_9LILI|nr:hypothetical protein Cni_G04270 [Canna indica]